MQYTAVGGKKESGYHQGDGIFLLAYSEGNCRIRPSDVIPARYFAAQLRQWIINLLEEIFPKDAGGFARALLLGDCSKLTYEQDTNLKISGIRHVVAVSGLHVSILFSMMYVIAGKKRFSTVVLGIPVLLLFAAVAGFTPSITRACIMQILMILALLFKKEYDPPTALAFAVLVMLVVNPFTITSVSFQLSAGCIIGIFFFNTPINSWILKRLGTVKGKTLLPRMKRGFAGSVSITLSTMIVTTPLSAYYFGTVSLIGIITNLLILWVVSYIFYGIILVCVLGSIYLPAGGLIAWIIAWPIRYVLGLSNLAASVPLSAIYTCSSGVVSWLVLVYLLFAIFILVKRMKLKTLCAGILSGLCVVLTVSWYSPRLDECRVTVLDVGQGQSILLQSRGNNYLVDCGGDDSRDAADTAAEQLLSQGITRLDGLILTHYDTDHAGGVLNLLSRIHVNQLYLPSIDDSGQHKKEIVQQFADKIQWIHAITKISAGQGSLILSPSTDVKDENESGLCILFQTQNCDILITGDRGESGEKKLMEEVALPKLDLLVVGHHGAETSACFDLLDRTRPDVAVISVGEDNRFGHPSADVLERLKAFDCTVFRTDVDGTVVLRSESFE